MSTAAPVVSFGDEKLILVDEHDTPLGSADKVACHRNRGQLHRAISVFLFNRQGEVLLQQRSAEKALWPLFWANSCCSHPRVGECTADAAKRRIGEELQLECTLTFIYKFIYQAAYTDHLAEHELCHVYAGVLPTHRQPHPNQHEIAAVQWLGPAALDAALRDAPQRYTPWLHLEWPSLRQSHWRQLAAMLTAG